MKKLRSKLYLGLIVSLLIVSGTSVENATAQTDSQNDIYEEIARLIVNMPADEQEEENWVNQQLSAFGGDAVRALSSMLMDPMVGSDLKARYALSSLANFTAGSDSEKQVFETAILDEVKKDRPIEVKRFLLEQLILTGSDRSVPVLEPYLTHERLYNNTLRVLLTLNTPSAVNAVRNTLPAVDGEQKIAMVKGLGEFRDKAAADHLIEFADSDQWPLKRMSFYALANIGAPGASEYFENAIQENDLFRESELVSYYLHYANRLADEGFNEESSTITDYFLESDFSAHIKNSALDTRFQLYSADILDELLETAQVSGTIRAKSALAMVNSLEHAEVTERIVDVLESAPESKKVYFIEALGERGERSAASILRNYTDNSNSEIRIAAIYSLYQLEGQIEPELVISVLNEINTVYGIQKLEELLHQMESENTVTAVANALPDVTEQAKPVLIHLLTVRFAEEYRGLVRNELHADDEKVRIAVYQYLGRLGDEEDVGTLAEQLQENISDEERNALLDSFVEVVNRSVPDADRNNLIRQYYTEGSTLKKTQIILAVPQIEGINKTGIMRSGLDNENREVQSAAIQSLREWNSADALPLLIQAAAMTSGEEQIAVISRYLRLVNDLDDPVNVKGQHLHELYNSMQSEDRKINVLEQFGQIDDLLALQAVSVYFTNNNENIRNAAYQIAYTLLLPHYTECSQVFTGTGAVLEVLNEDVRENIKSIMAEKKELAREDLGEEKIDAEPVYGSLFNGENLDGWEVIGDHPDSWGVEDGLLYTDGIGSGWISSESRYDDFVIELEYRVPEAGNSGLFIRAPHEGNPAYEGIEIQILDDYADRYANLEPWQFTGSIYFQEAPSKRITKPAGEWQTMKVRAEGPKIQVTLNGELIINTNLINYMENVDSHPGLVKRSGFIGLQNHGDRVDFRNITIKKIE